MTLAIPQLSKIQKLHSQGTTQRSIAKKTNHALGTINKYVRMLKVLSMKHPLIYELHCRYMLADNGYLTAEELQAFFRKELGVKLSKSKATELLKQEKKSTYKKTSRPLL